MKIGVKKWKKYIHYGNYTEKISEFLGKLVCCRASLPQLNNTRFDLFQQWEGANIYPPKKGVLSTKSPFFKYRCGSFKYQFVVFGTKREPLGTKSSQIGTKWAFLYFEIFQVVSDNFSGT